MSVITLDFETYYSKEFSLSKLTTEEYIRDKQFEVIGVAFKVDDGPTEWVTGSHDEIKIQLEKLDWQHSALLCHNTLFDGAILAWIFGIDAAMYFDTLCMARAVHGVDAGGSLAALVKRYELGEKGTEVVNALGKRRLDFNTEDLDRYALYCRNDVDLTYDLFNRLATRFPGAELELIDMTLRMFIHPALEIDDGLLTDRLDEIRQEKSALLAGLKAQKTDAVLAQIESGLKDFEAKKIVILSDLALPQGGKLRVATVDMAKLLPESAQAVALNNLPKNTPDETRKLVEQTYDAVQAKRFQFAWGALDGYVILACGKNLDHVRFVQSPATSVLAKPEMAWLAPHVQKNLLGISYLSAGTLSALNDDQPTVPMLRGVVSAMKESPTFKTMAESLEKRTAELSKTESAVYSAEATNLVAAAWWDRGVEAEFVGGLKPRFCLPGKPLKYQGLINLPGVFFGLAYHRDKGYDSLVRTWMEQLVGLVYTGAQELVKAGIAGPSGGQQFALFEMMLLPTFQKIYQADKDINDKGLGSEAAYIVDLNGKTPPLPGLPPAAKDMKFPRITTVSDIADRAELDKGWQSINDTVTTIASLAGSFAGASQPGTAPGQPAFVMPKPESIQSGDITTWYYKTDIFTGDLQPCAALNAQRLILSTSKAAAQSVATELATPSAKNVDGLVWKLDPGVAAELLTSSAALSQTPEQAKELKQTLKWIKPFHAATGRIYEQSGQWHSTLKWEITDVVKFD